MVCGVVRSYYIYIILCYGNSISMAALHFELYAIGTGVFSVTFRNFFSFFSGLVNSVLAFVEYL